MLIAVLELPGDGGIFHLPHCGCGPPCNTRRRSLGACVSVSSDHWLVDILMSYGSPSL